MYRVSSPVHLPSASYPYGVQTGTIPKVSISIVSGEPVRLHAFGRKVIGGGFHIQVCCLFCEHLLTGSGWLLLVRIIRILLVLNILWVHLRTSFHR